MYLGKGEYGRAISDLSRAIELNPKYSQAYNNRGFAHLNKRAYGLAIRDFGEAIRLDPSFALAHKNREITYRLQRRQ